MQTFQSLIMLKPLYFLLLARRRFANITLPYSYGLSSMLPLCAYSLFLCRQAKGLLASKPPPHKLSTSIWHWRAILFFSVGLLILTACGSGGGSGGSSSGADSPRVPVRGLDCLAEAGQDCDGDSVMDGADIDDDGDGLIEIRTAAQLDAVRHALNGNGRKLSADAEFDDTGCGGASGITECSGYELVKDISLATYVNADGGKGWQPLGNDTDSVNAGCQGAVFNGTFEGNGWTISDLSINRPTEDCVGLFGYIAADSEVRNLTLRAEVVIGGNFVGGLVGGGEEVRIVSSSVVAGEVRGIGAVGGLVGDGVSVWIHSSSVIAGMVRGTDNNVGGLVGNGQSARIHSSSVVASKLSSGDKNQVGGLIGEGPSAQVHSSSVVVGQLSGSTNVAGLLGRDNFAFPARIVSSSVVVGEVIGKGFVGGLVGTFSGQLAYSYVVSGSPTNMLAGLATGTVGAASYWDSDTSGVPPVENIGAPKTTSELRSPTGYTDIYANWTKDTDIFGDGMIDEPLAVWCDRDNSGDIGIGEKTPGNLIWDFGKSDEYPAIRCTPLAPDEWRDWWFLNATGKPELDRDRLEEALSQ